MAALPAGAADRDDLRRGDVQLAASAPGPAAPAIPAAARDSVTVPTTAPVLLALAEDLSPHERARILRAVNDWNLALNGNLRFEIVDGGNAADRSRLWSVMVYRGPATRQVRNVGYTLAATLPFAKQGGVVTLLEAEIGPRDLAAVMRHELGHVLGLGHGSGSRLMEANFNPHDQGCIDQTALDVLAQQRRWRAGSMRGC